MTSSLALLLSLFSLLLFGSGDDVGDISVIGFWGGKPRTPNTRAVHPSSSPPICEGSRT